MPDAALTGKLLVANPRLADPNFDRTVVLMLAHGEEGALGVVLNRPSETAVAEVLPRWSGLVADPPAMFVGGPVSHDSVICLARVPRPAVLQARAGPGEVWRPVVGDLGTLDLDLDPGATEDAVSSLRIFAGYSGWSAGQLDRELAVGGWWVLAVGAGDAFSAWPEHLWRDVLRRQPGDLALVAGYPPDPDRN